jgi:arylsulfatase A-like enzyme
MRLPGVIDPGSVHSQLLSNVDLFPTVCELAGVPVPDDLDGRSFVGLFKGETGPIRSSIFAGVNWARRGGGLCYGPHRCLRTERYKLIRNFCEEPYYLDGGFVGRHANDLDVLNNWPLFGNPSPTHELYDLAADPWEMTNLADDPAHEDSLLDLDMELNKLMEDTGDPAFHGAVPSQTDEPVKQQWAKGEDGTYRLDFDLETETKERPFQ